MKRTTRLIALIVALLLALPMAALAEGSPVVYRALYGDFGLWVRPAWMWNETVERDGKTFRRFTCIGQ